MNKGPKSSGIKSCLFSSSWNPHGNNFIKIKKKKERGNSTAKGASVCVYENNTFDQKMSFFTQRKTNCRRQNRNEQNTFVFHVKRNLENTNLLIPNRIGKKNQE